MTHCDTSPPKMGTIGKLVPNTVAKVSFYCPTKIFLCQICSLKVILWKQILHQRTESESVEHASVLGQTSWFSSHQ